jgi:hypothetical protein
LLDLNIDMLHCSMRGCGKRSRPERRPRASFVASAARGGFPSRPILL